MDIDDAISLGWLIFWVAVLATAIWALTRAGGILREHLGLIEREIDLRKWTSDLEADKQAFEREITEAVKMQRIERDQARLQAETAELLVQQQLTEQTKALAVALHKEVLRARATAQKKDATAYAVAQRPIGGTDVERLIEAWKHWIATTGNHYSFDYFLGKRTFKDGKLQG